ncbi:MAG: DUF5658 family protein [Pseudomonadota bacterium]
MSTTADNTYIKASGWFGTPLVLSGTAYIWIILAATLDILLTGIILSGGGKEINPLANAVLATYGFTGMVIFKYIVVFFILLGCEYVTRHNKRKGRLLSVALIIIHFAPVLWSTGLLIVHV